MKRIGILVLLLSLVAVNNVAYGQEKKSKKERRQEQAEKIQRIVNAQDYKFVAQRAVPMSGRSVHLTSEYDVSVNKDTIVAFLPYFGRAYTAPMNPTEGGIKFESTNFDYRIENAKKGGWTVRITIKDEQKRYELILQITTSGSATLSVNDYTRQSITFNGYVDERRKR